MGIKSYLIKKLAILIASFFIIAGTTLLN